MIVPGGKRRNGWGGALGEGVFLVKAYSETRLGKGNGLQATGGHFEMKRWPFKIVSAILLLTAFPLSLTAQETESEPTPVLGWQKMVLYEGWNLVSLPQFTPRSSHAATWSSIFDDLQAADDQTHADLIVYQDRDTGELRTGWRIEDGYWMGGLTSHSPTPGDAYWIYLRPGQEDRDSLVIHFIGEPRYGPSYHRGIFNPGTHLVGTIFSAPVPLEFSGLVESGLENAEGLLGNDPASGQGPEVVMGWDAQEQKYRVAFFDGNEWRGDLKFLEPAQGYLLHLNHSIDWDQYRLPDNGGEPSAMAGSTDGIKPVKKTEGIR